MRPLAAIRGDHFAGFTAEVRFIRNDAGQVSGLEATYPNGTAILAQRVKE